MPVKSPLHPLSSAFSVISATALWLLLSAPAVQAREDSAVSAIRADTHAPIAVMGDHTHKTGEWMVSYRYMRMEMKDNLSGSASISADEIVSSVGNLNAPPANVRVVPTRMTTDMHMVGLMYAPNDTVTLMAMFNYLKKEMEHTSYMGMMGTNVLGRFTTETSGVGDTRLGALVNVLQQGPHRLHVNLGVSLPTGSIDEEATVLTPMNTRPTIRTPYGMQLGSGTYDLEPGITYNGGNDTVRWGAQYRAVIHLGENDEHYTLGDSQQLTAWSSYLVNTGLSVSLRLSYIDQDKIEGRDQRIAAPVTTANPDNYGGERLDAGVGLNYVVQQGMMRGHRFALEYETTLDQDANGVQMAMQSMLTLGYQYAF